MRYHLTEIAYKSITNEAVGENHAEHYVYLFCYSSTVCD